jgi:hypothetical protein
LTARGTALMLLSMGTRPIYHEELHAHYPFNLYGEEKVREKLTYMHQNPVRAGLVAQPCDWAFSSARYYEQGRSVGVPIRCIA